MIRVGRTKLPTILIMGTDFSPKSYLDTSVFGLNTVRTVYYPKPNMLIAYKTKFNIPPQASIILPPLNYTSVLDKSHNWTLSTQSSNIAFAFGLG